MNRKAQAGVEYMALFAVVSLALLVVSYFFYTGFQIQSRTTQARIAVDRIANAVDSVAAQGQGSSKVVNVYFPPGILNATVMSREVRILIASSNGQANDVFQVTLANVSFVQLPLTEGNKYLTVTFNATGNVSIMG